MLWKAALLGVAVSLGAGAANAVTFGFSDVDGLEGGPTIESQFTLDVIENAGNVEFTLSNSGPVDAIATQINFDDQSGLLGGFVQLIEMVGVDFEDGPAPSNLPQGNGAGFVSTFGFDRVGQGGVNNGVNPNESLGIVFGLGGNTLADILAGLDDGSLNVGIHVQSIDTAPAGASDSDTLFVDVTPIPLPAAGWLLFAGIGGLAVFRRRGA